MKTKEKLPSPSTEEVERYLLLWKQLDNYREQEEALSVLFKQYPGHSQNESTGVLLKVVALNHFYSTNIFNVYAVAKRILGIPEFDEKLRDGDLSVVEDLRDKNRNGTGRDLYSFATKYCSHHMPEKFPIYDSYVHKALDYFYRADKGFADEFAEIRELRLTRYNKTVSDIRDNEDVPLRKSYAKFKEVIEVFRKHYELTKFGLKQVDQYLWQLGKDWFPNSYQSDGEMKSRLKVIADQIASKEHYYVDVADPESVKYDGIISVERREIGIVRAAIMIDRQEQKRGRRL